MVKGLGYHICEGRLRELGPLCLQKGRVRKDFINPCRYLKGGCNVCEYLKGGFFSVVPSDRNKRHKPKCRMGCLNIKKHIFTLRMMEDWKQVAKADCGLLIPGDVTNTGSGNWLWVILPDQGS